MSLYAKRGVSAQKEEVHAAVSNLDQGLYPKAFCKIYKDVLGGDEQWVNIMHADGAGTKAVLAYLYWKETNDIAVWKGIAQDAIVMNIDDLLCTGIYKNLLFSSSIDRNKNLIPGEILKTLIDGSQEFFGLLGNYGIDITYMGGETADVGDVVRTIAVNGTMTARWPKEKLITNEKIKPGNVIIGLSSYGQTIYEKEYNSGIGSNGLTSARHDVLNKRYKKYKESYDDALKEEVVYIGKYELNDEIEIDDNGAKIKATIGKLLLSPTRTFAPVLKEILETQFEYVSGLIHCSGGGQTKCLKYVPDNIHIIKDNLFKTPPLFEIIQECSGADNKEMFQVFNMGCRMEIYTDELFVDDILSIAQGFDVNAQVIGRVEEAGVKSLSIHFGEEIIRY